VSVVANACVEQACQLWGADFLSLYVGIITSLAHAFAVYGPAAAITAVVTHEPSSLLVQSARCSVAWHAYVSH